MIFSSKGPPTAVKGIMIRQGFHRSSRLVVNQYSCYTTDDATRQGLPACMSQAVILSSIRFYVKVDCDFISKYMPDQSITITRKLDDSRFFEYLLNAAVTHYFAV